MILVKNAIDVVNLDIKEPILSQKMLIKDFTYKIKLEAIKSQRKHPNLIPCSLETKLKSIEAASSNVEESEMQIYSSICLTKLINELRDKVDAREIIF